MKNIFSTTLLLFAFVNLFAQDEDKIIHTKEGTSLGTKKTLVIRCKNSYAAPIENKLIKQICECQVDLLDRRFSLKQIKAYQKKYKEDGFSQLIEEDTLLKRQLKDCLKESKNIELSSIPEYKQNFINRCIDNLKMNTTKLLNDTLATLFCSCAADVMEKRKITLEKLDDLNDPSSFLYNEIAYKCGSPFLEPSDFAKDWKESNFKDIIGNMDSDSVPVIPVMGMHKVKITIGNQTRIWLLDSGASDLLISEEFAKILKQQGFISEMNFAGEGLYTLANNKQIACKRYKIDSLRIGKFIINNVILSVSKETGDFLAGKSLLNKFSRWEIDNKNNLLILRK